MRAHLLGESGDLLVTGTQDVDAARPLAYECLIENGLTDEEAASDLTQRTARTTSGVTVPTSQPDRQWLGYTWWWREGDGGGRVKAVLFEHEPARAR